MIGRPIRLLNALIVAGCIWCLKQGRYRGAFSAGACLALAFLVAWANSIKGLHPNYLIYPDIWSFLAAAILLAEVTGAKAAEKGSWLRNSAFALVALVLLLQVDKLGQRGMVAFKPPSDVCGAIRHTPEIAPAFARHCPPRR